MEKFKFVLFSIVVLVLVGIFGYWSITTIQSGTEYAKDQKIKQLEKENEDLKKEVVKLGDDLSALQSRLPEPAPVVETEPKVTAYKYQDFINELQKMVSNNTFLKLKSRGGNVGTVQKFLNLYNDTTNKVDNDYGAGTVNAVKAFQKDSGLSADGEAGPSTFNKMIDWLKEQK